jgi:polyisoprenoid-binding protein YceI
MTRAIPLLLVTVAATLVAAATMPPTRYQVVAGSQFWIDGSSTMGRFTCAGNQVTGAGQVDEQAVRVSGEIHVPVQSFNCGQARMNRDMRRALKGDEHPSIRFAVDRVEMLGDARPGAWVRVRASGRLRLAGVERAVTLSAQGQRLRSGNVQIQGRHPLRMTDFGVTPPSGLAGMVRARNDVVARFDLIAAPQR